MVGTRPAFWIVPLALSLAQCRSHSRTAAPGSARASTSKAPATVRSAALPPSSRATIAAPLRVVPLLDADKGRRALAAYPRASAGAKALASGAFTAAGEDEVLLSVASGRDRAAGDHALALMRAEKGRYRFVGFWLVANDTFTARLRLATRGGKDALVVCHQGGQQGLYSGSCGFFGQGGFAKGSKSLDSNTADVPTGFVTSCGPGRSVSLQSVSPSGDTVHFEVELERSVRSPGKGEQAGGDYCSRVRTTGRKRYAIDYRYDGTSFQRTLPIPASITNALADNER